MKDITIPELTPYLGKEEKNFIGGGIAGAGGDPDGVWDFLIGPMYSSPNFIDREEITVIVDDIEHSLDMKIQRARGSGIFYRIQNINGLQVVIADFAPIAKPYVVRSIFFNNQSGIESHTISIKAEITPCNRYRTIEFGENIREVYIPQLSSHTEIIRNEALSICQDTTALCYGGENQNWADRYAFIAFNHPSTASALTINRFQICTQDQQLAPGQKLSCGLFHYMHFNEGISELKYHEIINQVDLAAEYESCVKDWEEWLAKGVDSCSRDRRVKDIIESGLVFIRMQQCIDGGFIAGVRRYSFSYLRDGHGAVRGLLAAGHAAEVKKFIQWVHHKCEVFGMIPNSAEMGADLKMLQFLGPEHLASETTAYYIFAVRDYYKRTGDIEFLKSLSDSMKTAMDTQLKYAKKFGWKMMFNGDETERYVPFRDGDIYGGFPALPDWKDEDWSMCSLAACLASLEFYRFYLKIIDKEELSDEYLPMLDSIRNSLDDNFWNRELGIHNWCKKKDGSIPDYQVTNFNLIPLWIGSSMSHERQNNNAAAMIKYINDKGFLPIAPGVNEGFCGHSLGYLLYDLVKIGNEKTHEVFETLTSSAIIGCWGTVSEFYGPNGTANPHNLRIFESGINLEAIIEYCLSLPEVVI